MLKDTAISLRKDGYSYSQIREKIGVSKSTLSYWLRDIPYRPNKEALQRMNAGRDACGLRRHKEKIALTKSIKEQAVKEVGKLTKRDLFMLGIGLYIGEGSKSIESVRIINSDPKVIKLGLLWLRECCGLSDNNFSIILFSYPDVDEDQAIKYWSVITQLPRDAFKKTQIDSRSGKSRVNHGKLPYGTVQIRVKSNKNPKHGVQLFRRIEGWTEAAVKYADVV